MTAYLIRVIPPHLAIAPDSMGIEIRSHAVFAFENPLTTGISSTLIHMDCTHRIGFNLFVPVSPLRFLVSFVSMMSGFLNSASDLGRPLYSLTGLPLSSRCGEVKGAN